MPESSYVPPKTTRKSLVYLAVTLFVLWLLWSGHYTVDFAALFGGHGLGGHGLGEGGHEPVNVLLLALGLLSSVGVTVLCHRMGIVDNETVPYHLAVRSLRYIPWLAWQVVLANIEVIRRILWPTPADLPETVVVEGGQRSDVGRATYANSITLTPGTVTIDVTGGTFTVHALTSAAAEDLRSGGMDREVVRFEGLS